jgi:regulator of nucleoside diphosphate kinase
MQRSQIIITTSDYIRLQSLLTSNLALAIGGRHRLQELEEQLRSARVVQQDSVPADVVTMHSSVKLRDLDTGEIENYSLVYPERADIANGKLSILAPIGLAILGYRVGEEVDWQVPSGTRRLRVEEVEYQPERVGDFHL